MQDEFRKSLKGRTARGRLARRLSIMGLNEVQYQKVLAIWKQRAMSHKDCEYIVGLLCDDGDLQKRVYARPEIYENAYF